VFAIGGGGGALLGAAVPFALIMCEVAFVATWALLAMVWYEVAAGGAA
jgi:hypothetical protein